MQMEKDLVALDEVKRRPSDLFMRVPSILERFSYKNHLR